ncbi:unnamed protein product [Pedinophyceae sp. YPF-701]|nr:unnamed protein product [Pedinophyceae sp. YPF-701]
MYGDADRQEHIAELLSGIPGFHVSPDRTTYDLQLETPDGLRTGLRVALPAGFPSDAPVLMVTRAINHVNVNPSTGRMSFPALDRWSHPATRLLEIADEAYTLLAGRGPPSPMALTPGDRNGGAYQARHAGPSASEALRRLNLSSASPAGSDATSQRVEYTSQGRAGPSAAGTPPPSVSPQAAIKDHLAKMSTTALLDLMKDDEKVLDLAEELRARMAGRGSLASLQAANREKAQQVLDVESDIRDARNNAQIVRTSELVPLQEEVKGLQQQQDEIMARYSTAAILERLAEKRTELEERAAEAERAVVELRGGEGSVDALERYVAARADLHAAAAKAEAIAAQEAGRA